MPIFRVSLAVALFSIAAFGNGQARSADGDFPGAAWERASSLEAIGWSSGRVAIVNLMNTDDETGPRIGSNEWDALLAEILAARTR